MAINETIVTGRKFRKLIDEATKQWQRISFWTKANDVEFDDGTNAETKFGAVNGITDSLTSTSSNVAASAAAVKALNDKITKLNSDLLKTPIVVHQSAFRQACSASVNVTPGKHYLLVYVWGNSFQSGSGWADDNYTLTGGDSNLLAKTQSSTASGYYSGRIVLYVTAKEKTILFTKEIAHNGMVGSFIVIQLF